MLHIYIVVYISREREPFIINICQNEKIKIPTARTELIHFRDMLDYVCRRYRGDGTASGSDSLHNISSSFQMQI